MRDETIAKKVDLMESKLIQVVSHHKGVKELAENPLLLTLLAVMQQNSIELPRERVELYKVVTFTCSKTVTLLKVFQLSLKRKLFSGWDR